MCAPEPLPQPAGQGGQASGGAAGGPEGRLWDLLGYAAGLPGAWVGDKPEWGTVVASVGPRLFALALYHTDGRLLVNVKLEPDDVVSVRQGLDWVGPGFHQAKRHWVSMDLTHPGYEGATAAQLVEESYQLVRSRLPGRVRTTLDLAVAAGEPARPIAYWQHAPRAEGPA